MAAELVCTATAAARRWVVVDGAIAVAVLLWFGNCLADDRYRAAAVVFVSVVVFSFRTIGGMLVRVTLTEDRLISRQVLGALRIRRSGIVEVTVEPFRGQLWRLGMLHSPSRPLHQCVVTIRSGKRIPLLATRDQPTPDGTPGPHVSAAASHISRWLASTPVAP
jgi:hypothetical protein